MYKGKNKCVCKTGKISKKKGKTLVFEEMRTSWEHVGNSYKLARGWEIWWSRVFFCIQEHQKPRDQKKDHEERVQSRCFSIFSKKCTLTYAPPLCKQKYIPNKKSSKSIIKNIYFLIFPDDAHIARWKDLWKLNRCFSFLRALSKQVPGNS